MVTNVDSYEKFMEVDAKHDKKFTDLKGEFSAMEGNVLGMEDNLIGRIVYTLQ